MWIHRLRPRPDDGIDPEDVNISYAVHSWARGQGIAVQAVRLICDVLRTNQIGRRAAILAEPETGGRSVWQSSPASDTSETFHPPGTHSLTELRRR